MAAGRLWKMLGLVVLPLAGVAAALLLVELAKRAGHLPATIPAPSQVWDALLANPRGIGLALADTATNAVTGYAVAAVAALGAGLAATLVAALRPPIYNVGVGLASIPLIATTPLLALWLGTGSLTRSLIAGLASYFPLLVGALQGFRAYEASDMELFHVYSASRWRIFRSLILPRSLPYLFAGFKLAAPLAVLGSLTAELTGADNGIGVLMLSALFAFDVSQVWLTVLIACGLSGTGYALWALIERVAIYWDPPAELKS
jgi:ABC-type nitrate/sulfonate/bicarbonate transport system permease component